MATSKFVRAINTNTGKEQVVPRHWLENNSPFPNFKPADAQPADGDKPADTTGDDKSPATPAGDPDAATTSGASADRKKGK